MNIQQFQYILAVNELKNFGKAADKCFITQSTLSTMIVRFEEEIGITIFDRKTKPVTVTKEGATIIQQLRIITKEINNLEQQVQAMKGQLTGDLKIGVIPTVAPYLLPRFLGPFTEQFPLIRFEISEMTTSTILKQLQSRQLDVGLASIPLKAPDLMEVPIYNEPFIFYDSQAEQQAPQRMDQIDPERLWLLEEGHCLRTQVEKLCDFDQLRRQKASNLKYKSGTIDSLLRIVRMNKGLTFLPQMATLDFPAGEQEKLHTLGNPVPVRTIGLVVHRHFVKKQILEHLQKAIAQVAEDLLPAPVSGSCVINPL